MKVIWTLLIVSLLAGCSQSKSEVEIVAEFWDAVASRNLEAIKPLLADPATMQVLEGSDITLTQGGYEVLDKAEQGVNVRFSDKCLVDVVTPTVVVTVDEEPRVDLIKTLSLGMKARASAKLKSRYCYAFEDQPMQGKIGGKPWKAHHLNRAIIDFGTTKSEQLKIVSEPCQDKWCNGLETPSLLLNFELSGAGGNFDSRNNITIFTPPQSNKVVTEGSYRLSKAAENQTKLEISFIDDKNNSVNGFITFPAGGAEEKN